MDRRLVGAVADLPASLANEVDREDSRLERILQHAFGIYQGVREALLRWRRNGEALPPEFRRKGDVIPTRMKADSFWGFQTGASQIPWWRTGGSPCGQGLRFARMMTQPSFGAWRKRPGTRVKVGGCWRWPRSTMAALGPKPRRSAASCCRPSGTGWCGSTPAGLTA